MSHLHNLPIVASNILPPFLHCHSRSLILFSSIFILLLPSCILPFRPHFAPTELNKTGLCAGATGPQSLKMLPRDFFHRLPTPTAALLLSSLLSLAAAHVPRQTPTTIPHRPLNVVAYPPVPAPTSPPLDLQALHELLRRHDTNTVCGYINGDIASAATCSVGSHCVQDLDAGVVGCCPNGEETCSSGIYTACVDANSGVQTEVNPYIFTCTQGHVCYSNMFEGGFSQFGCGTASDLAATVLASASGAPSSIVLTTADVVFTQSSSALATPTTLGTATASESSSSSSSTGSLTTITVPTPSTATRTTSTASSSSSTASSSTAAATAAPGVDAEGSSGKNTGAIVGGTIGGIAAIVGLAAVAAFFYSRRMAGNSRQGPGPRPGDTQYISPMTGRAGGAFVPISQDGRGPSSPATVGGKTIRHITGGPERNTVWQPDGDMAGQQFLDHRAAGTGWASSADGGYRGAYASPHDSGDDQVPLRQGSPEIDDFTMGFHDALSRIGEEDEESIRNSVNGAAMGGNQGTGDLGEEARPLWLQSRRQSRNVMWT